MEKNQKNELTAEDDDFSDITLRLMGISDIDDFMVWATDDEVSKFCVWDT